MPERMEGNVFGNASCFKPFLQGVLCHNNLKSLEHFSMYTGSFLGDKLISLFTNGNEVTGFRFLGLELHIFVSVYICPNVIPFEVDDVASAHSCQTSKNRSTLKDIYFARCFVEVA